MTSEQLLDETVMLGLRTDGIDLFRLKEDFGFDLFNAERSTIDQLIADQLAVLERNKLRLTDRGFLLCDEISELLLSRVSAD